MQKGWRFSHLTLCVLMVCPLALAFPASAAEYCGSLANMYGPYDYRIDKDKLKIVEDFHFTPEVEMLRRGKSGNLGGDLDYTLRAFPNHHRALLAMMRLAEREKRAQPLGARYTLSCYFERALRFRPDDEVVRLLYGMHLAKQGKKDEALRQLDQVANSSTDKDALTHYNLGLTYLDLGRSDQALHHAQLAYQMGIELPGLRNKLVKAGIWRETSSATRGEGDKTRGAAGNE